MTRLTNILQAIGRGEHGASEALFTAVYDELRQMAVRRLAKESSGHTLQATALVSEAYLRLVGTEEKQWENRYHFFVAAAEAMRRILIDAARKRQRLKRGGGAKRVELTESKLVIFPVSDELLDLDEAIEKFQQVDPKKAALVKLRFFGGLSNQEAAEVLDIGLSTAERYWTYARAWLKNAMGGDPGNTKREST